MKKIIGLFGVLALLSLLSVSAMAKPKSHTISFGEDLMVGNTLLKKGTYRLKYDKQAQELSIYKSGSKKLLAESKVKVEERRGHRSGFDYSMRERDGNEILESVAFPRSKQKLVLEEY